MIFTIIACLISSAVTLSICWLFLIPKQINEVRDSARSLLVIYHNDEVQPLQNMLKGYPDIVEEIHDDISKLEFAVDLLSSEGQSIKPNAKILTPSELKNLPLEIQEYVNNPK